MIISKELAEYLHLLVDYRIAEINEDGELAFIIEDDMDRILGGSALTEKDIKKGIKNVLKGIKNVFEGI